MIGTPKSLTGIAKCPTGIRGLDDVTNGGFPQGRPTLVCGAAGSGKTLLAMEFIVRGARDFGEPGVFMAFDEAVEELTANVASLGFDLAGLMAAGKLALDYVRVERSEIEETGEFDLEGLFVRLGLAIDRVGAKRVALDSLESLFAGLPNEAILRAELRRLFRWLKQRGVTAVITGELGRGTLTRHGLEEYISDCVIFLDHRVVNQVATRRLRVVKYRGTAHGTNEYPTLIDQAGLSVLPISSLHLDYPVSTERVSTGIRALDAMFGEQGYYRGSSILISGTAGTGKSSLAAAFADATCRRGEACLYLAFEEAPAQIQRNMASIGFDLGAWVEQGLLRFHAVRPALCGLEQHLLTLHRLVDECQPRCLVMDPITNLAMVGEQMEIEAMLTRVVDYLKQQSITAVFTSLVERGSEMAYGSGGVSSLMDTWMEVSQVESSGGRKRQIRVLKSRGMAHVSDDRIMRLCHEGIDLDEAPP